MNVETPHTTSHIEAEEEPDDLLDTQHDWRTHPGTLTWQEHLAIGDSAYAEAVAHEDTYGLDSIAIEKYKMASQHLISVTATGSLLHEGTISSEPEPADPLRLLKIAGSLAKQAQATPVNEFYDTRGSRHIDVKTNKQRIAAETLQRASRLLMGEETHADHTAMIAEFDVESPAEAIVVAAVAAAKETGTANRVHGAQAVRNDTPERLEAAGEDAVVSFIEQHALETGPRGLAFVARTAEITVEAVEEMTDEHTLPAAA